MDWPVAVVKCVRRGITVRLLATHISAAPSSMAKVKEVKETFLVRDHHSMHPNEQRMLSIADDLRRCRPSHINMLSAMVLSRSRR